MIRPLAILLTFVLTTLLALTARAEPVTYTFDPSHTYIGISWNHLGFSTQRARFGEFSGTLVLDEEDPANSSVSVSIRIDSLDTGVDRLDEELMGPDFFDAETYPVADFESERVELAGENTAVIHGALTLKGQSHPLTLDVMLNQIGANPINNRRTAGFEATSVIDRMEYGIDKYVPAVSAEIGLDISAEAAVAE